VKGKTKTADETANKAAIELPLNRLPPSLRRQVSAVSFGAPLDYGPAGSFHAD